MCNHISKKRGTVKCNRVKNMKQDKVKYDFKAFGQAIKAARKAKGISRNQLADTLNIAPRYIASIENSGESSDTECSSSLSKTDPLYPMAKFCSS